MSIACQQRARGSCSGGRQGQRAWSKAAGPGISSKVGAKRMPRVRGQETYRERAGPAIYRRERAGPAIYHLGAGRRRAAPGLASLQGLPLLLLLLLLLLLVALPRRPRAVAPHRVDPTVPPHPPHPCLPTRRRRMQSGASHQPHPRFPHLSLRSSAVLCQGPLARRCVLEYAPHAPHPPSGCRWEARFFAPLAAPLFAPPPPPGPRLRLGRPSASFHPRRMAAAPALLDCDWLPGAPLPHPPLCCYHACFGACFRPLLPLLLVLRFVCACVELSCLVLRF